MALTGELSVLRERVLQDLGRVVAALEPLTAEEASWKPLPDGTSVYALAMHVLGSAENMLLEFSGGRSARDRDGEFLVGGDPRLVPARLTAARERISAAFEALDPAKLDAELVRGAPATERRVPVVTTVVSQGHTMRHLLFQQVAHIAEHAGHAELTRDLARARSAPG